MARIRSIHPGLFTDDAFVSVSPFARLLVLGIWTECDDQGVFEWKPNTLKIRILPLDNTDVPSLLAELEAANIIKNCEIGGRQLGLVRNFAKYQRPKSPKLMHVIPSEWRSYVGLDHSSGEIGEVQQLQFSRNGEIGPQMERREGENIVRLTPSEADLKEEFDGWYRPYPRHEGRKTAEKAYVLARKKVSREILMAAVHRAATRYSGTEPRFIPLPATWLNGERWNDETRGNGTTKAPDGII